MKVRYRIKTEDEFIEEYGKDWKYEIDWCIHGRMDYLLGKEVDKNTEHQIDGWWIHEYMIKEITEKTMTEKIQMTEEQAREISNLMMCTSPCSKYPNKCEECGINILKHAGYIIKSELEKLVEEAEEMYNNRKNIEDKNEYDYWIEWYRKLASKQNETIQALKKSHPEFNKWQKAKQYIEFEIERLTKQSS